MLKKTITCLLSCILFLLIALLLIFPAQSIVYSARGLELWFQKMIPSLFPFMVLSGMLVRLNLTDAVVRLFKPVLRPLFRVNDKCIYAIIIGFLCGFPMGAQVTATLYRDKLITKREAEYLLSFCNNIGPVYFLSFALPVLGISNALPALGGMYGIPLLYGIFLRYTNYSDISMNPLSTHLTEPDIKLFIPTLDQVIMDSLGGITKLGGYMIVFNMLNLLPCFLIHNPLLSACTSCFLEISGGLSVMSQEYQFWGLIMLQFGGLSCLFQTYTMIKDTDLSILLYLKNKIIITVLCFFYYLVLTGISCVS